MEHRTLSAALLAVCALSCDVAESTAGETDCQTVVETFAACYPDLETEAVCTDETVAQFEEAGITADDCSGVEAAGKADIFSAFGGCAPGEHVCGWIFCCGPYELTWSPEAESDWDITDAIDRFEASAPADELEKIEGASVDELRNGVKVGFIQPVTETLGGEEKDMVVEITRLLVDAPYETVISVLPPQQWGPDLVSYLGGEISIVETDDQGRATRQLERMVLSPYPLDLESPLSNNDITKVEVIEYGSDVSTVYWRVMFSDNKSTEADIGSLEYRRFDDDTTLLTFHSAHRLNFPGGLHIPNDVVKIGLAPTFLGMLKFYRDLVGERTR